MLLGELVDVTFIHVKAHGLAERHNLLHHCRFGFESFDALSRQSLRPQVLPRHGFHSEAYHDVVLFPELSMGEVCASRHPKAAAEQVLGEELEIRNHLLVVGLQSMGGVGWKEENLYNLEVRWVSRCIVQTRRVI